MTANGLVIPARMTPGQGTEVPDPASFCAEVELVTEAFVRLQQQCGVLLQNGLSGDFSSCYDQRQRIFELFQLVVGVWRNTPALQANRDVKEVLQRNLLKMTEEEKKLEQHALVARQELDNALNSLRKGKKGLSGYRCGALKEDTPRFLSSRM